MTKNQNKNREDGYIVQTIAGVRFVTDPMGFVRSSEGELGHTEQCEEIGAFFADLLAIADEIERRP